MSLSQDTSLNMPTPNDELCAQDGFLQNGLSTSENESNRQHQQDATPLIPQAILEPASLNSDNHEEDPEIADNDLQLDSDTQCGFENFRMPFLQRFARIECFTGYYSMAALLTSTLGVYVNSQVTTLERQFGFSSTQTGLIMSANDIGFLVCVLFLSYNAVNFHIPRALGISTCVFALSGLACALPFFIFRPQIDVLIASFINVPSANGGNTTVSESEVKISQTQSKIYGDLCVHNRSFDESCKLSEDGDLTSSSSSVLSSYVVNASLGIIFVGMMLQGFGKSPRFSFITTYIDSNTKRNNTGFYLGIIITSGIFGPTLAFALGAMFGRIFVTLEETTLTPKHPNWIGAWWLGYLVCGAVALIVALPLMLFPRRLPMRSSKKSKKSKNRKQDHKGGSLLETIKETEKENLHVEHELLHKVDGEDTNTKPNALDTSTKHSFGKENFLVNIKSFLASLLRLWSNPVYMCVIISSCCTIFNVSGKSAYSPKYLEQIFNLPSYQANILMAAKTMCAACLGTFIGGWLTKKYKMTAKQSLNFIAAVTFISFLGTVMGFLFACDQPTVHNWPGENQACNEECGCHEDTFFAVCGSDGRSYYSPCMAGCDEIANEVYHNCTCIPDEGQATPGICPYVCTHLYPYMVSLAIVSLFGTLSIVPKMVIFLRCVQPRDKGIALGFGQFMTSLLGWMAGPIAFGYFIDGICTVWDVTPCGGQGRCLLYDNDLFRVKLHAYGAVATSLSLVFLIIGVVYAHFTGVLDEKPINVGKGEGHEVKSDVRDHRGKGHDENKNGKKKESLNLL